jgi:hypothetical protein
MSLVAVRVPTAPPLILQLAHVREVTANLSAVVESTVALWNQFAAETGSFANDHPTL